MVARLRPDVVVRNARIDNIGRPLLPSDRFTFRVQVTNDGAITSSATTLNYFRSSDAMVSTSNELVGTDTVDALVASASSEETIRLTAPSAEGVHYYSACAAPVLTEAGDPTGSIFPAVTDNNCSKAVSLLVGPPDLTVSASVSDSTLTPGQSFTLRATVHNAGNGDAAAATLRYYRSTDSTITTSDTSVGSDSVSALAAGATSAESFNLTAPNTDGTYYYGACITAATGESNIENNCSDGAALTVEAAPDLVVTVSDTPTGRNSIYAVQENYLSYNFFTRTTVRNTGRSTTAPTTIVYYRSTDATITTEDTPVRHPATPNALLTTSIDSLAANSSITVGQWLPTPTTPGTHYYGACVNSICSNGHRLDVRGGPDLRVFRSAATGNRYVEGQRVFNLEYGVVNVGNARSVPTTLRFYASGSWRARPTDSQIHTVKIPALEPAMRGDRHYLKSTTIPPSLGWYGACVDSVRDEAFTDNNCSLTDYLF